MEESFEGEAGALEEGAVAAAAVHELVREFAAELESGLGDQAGQPRDALDGIGLCGELVGIDGGDAGAGSGNLGEVVESDALDRQCRVERWLSIAVEILDEVEEVLGGAADAGEEGAVVRGDEA